MDDYRLGCDKLGLCGHWLFLISLAHRFAGEHMRQVLNSLAVLLAGGLGLEVDRDEPRVSYLFVIEEGVQKDFKLLATRLEEGLVQVAEELLAWEGGQTVWVSNRVFNLNLHLANHRVAVTNVE